jgi:type IV pili sensor histidine kinase/response regulator
MEVRPNDAQQDLLRQIVNIEVSSTEGATVGDALNGVLLRSGYRLCAHHEDTQRLAALPLPAVHNPLGPLTLRDALEVLAGRGWQLEVDESIREICFTRRP